MCFANLRTKQKIEIACAHVQHISLPAPDKSEKATQLIFRAPNGNISNLSSRSTVRQQIEPNNCRKSDSACRFPSWLQTSPRNLIHQIQFYLRDTHPQALFSTPITPLLVRLLRSTAPFLRPYFPLLRPNFFESLSLKLPGILVVQGVLHIHQAVHRKQG